MIVIAMTDALRTISICDYKTAGTDYREGIVSLTPITGAIDTEFGGRVRTAYGSFRLAPDALGKENFPPPRIWDCTVRYVEETDLSEKLLFAGKVYLREVNAEYIEYSMLTDTAEKMLLVSADTFDPKAMHLTAVTMDSVGLLRIFWSKLSNGVYILRDSYFPECSPPGPAADPAKCVGCAACVPACPVEIIEMQAGKAVIDPDECIGCEACIEACDYGAVSLTCQASPVDLGSEPSAVIVNISEKLDRVSPEEVAPGTWAPVVSGNEVHIVVSLPDGANPNTKQTYQHRIDDAAKYEWRLATGKTKTYYAVRAAGGGNPHLVNPAWIHNATSGAKYYRGSQAGAELGNSFYFGDYDSLGFETVYVVTGAGTPPGVSPYINLTSCENDWLIAVFEQSVGASVPRAFGAVEQVAPLRMNDRNGMPTYHASWMNTDILPFPIHAAAPDANYPDETRFTVIGGFPVASHVRVEGTINFDGISAVSYMPPAASPYSFVTLKKKYQTDRKTGIIYQVTAENPEAWFPFRVYDDGVPITENVVVNTDGTFSLTARPVGTVTMSGVAYLKTLQDVFAWGAAELGLTLDAANSEPSGVLSVYADENKPLTEFLSELAAACLHFFYIEGGVLTLSAMNKDNGVLQLTESHLIDETSAGYTVPELTSKVAVSGDKKISAIWTEAAFGKTAELQKVLYSRAKTTDLLNTALELLNRPQASCVTPLDTEIRMGMRITWMDTRYPVDMPTAFRVRALKYDYIGHEMSIEGEHAPDEALNGLYGFPDVTG